MPQGDVNDDTYVAEMLRDDHEPRPKRGNYVQNADDSGTDAQPTHSTQGNLLQPIHKHMQLPGDFNPTFNLGSTPGGSLLPMQELVQDIQQPVQEPVKKPLNTKDIHPSFHLGLTSSNDGNTNSSSLCTHQKLQGHNHRLLSMQHLLLCDSWVHTRVWTQSLQISK